MKKNLLFIAALVVFNLTLIGQTITVTYTNPGSGYTFTVPEGATNVTAQAWGAGGGGGTAAAGLGTAKGGGGGGGAYTTRNYGSANNTNLSISVGNGGNGGDYSFGSSNGSAGGSSSISYLGIAIQANGGNAGSGATSVFSSANGNGGSGGSWSGGTSGTNGGDGQNGGNGGNGANGGAGGVIPGGNGNGANGQIIGGGGSGARKNAGVGGYSGGDGARGQVVITFEHNISSTITIAAINNGNNATFSIVNPQGGVTYTWRRDGNAIATGTSYSSSISGVYDAIASYSLSYSGGNPIISTLPTIAPSNSISLFNIYTNISYFHNYGENTIAFFSPTNPRIVLSSDITSPTIDLNVINGYHVDSYSDNSINVTSLLSTTSDLTGTIYQYTINNVTEDRTINATIKVNDFYIYYTIHEGNGYFNGELYEAVDQDLSDSYSVNYEDSFSLLADYGYRLDNVIVDGINQGEIYSYSFLPVILEDHQVEIYFHPKWIEVTTEVIGEGTLLPGDSSWWFDPTLEYAFEAHAAFENRIHYVTIDGNTENLADLVLTDYNGLLPAPIGENHHIVVAYDNSQIKFITHSGLGTIDGTDVDATNNDVITYRWLTIDGNYNAIFTPAPGYKTARVLVNGIERGSIAQYFFYHINSQQIVEIWFEKETYTIATIAYGQGTISEGVTFEYNPTFTYNYTVTPATGQYITSLTVDNIEIPILDREAPYQGIIAAPILSNHSIVARFAEPFHNVVASSNAGGFITPYGSTTYRWGTTPVYHIVASEGYFISNILIDGIAENMVGYVTAFDYAFDALLEDHTIEAIFSLFSYTITASVNGNEGGVITPEGTLNYDHFSSIIYSITAANGYDLQNVEVDGVSVGAVTSYTFTEISENHTIVAFFTKHLYTITAYAGLGGTITATGAYEYNSSVTYTVTPDAASGYQIDYVTVDGITQNIPSPTTLFDYTFDNIADNHEISAHFVLRTYSITATQPANGTITPAGVTTINYGGSQSYTISPNTGYEVEFLTINGLSVNFTTEVDGTVIFNFNNITNNRTITATMKAKTYSITASATIGGSITPAGTTTVGYGTSKTYSFAAFAGFTISNIKIDGFNYGVVSSYTFENIEENHTIVAEFVVVPCVLPSVLSVTDVTENSAVLHWDNLGANHYRVAYKAANETQFTETGLLSDTLFRLMNLTPNTRYTWKVKSICTVEDTLWSSYLQFVTLPTPPTSSIFENSINGITVYSNTNNVYIVNESSIVIEKVEIFNIYGQLVYTGKANSDREVISLSVSKGTYIVKLSTNSGVITKKVMLIE